jgi:hypothetical protein
MGRSNNTSGSSCGLGSCLCVIILAGIGGGLAWYFTKGGGTVQDMFDYIPTLSDFQKEEPFQGETPDEVPRWENAGNGIQLEIIDALDNRWYVRRLPLSHLTDMPPHGSPCMHALTHFQLCSLYPGIRTLLKPSTTGTAVVPTCSLLARPLRDTIPAARQSTAP